MRCFSRARPCETKGRMSGSLWETEVRSVSVASASGVGGSYHYSSLEVIIPVFPGPDTPDFLTAPLTPFNDYFPCRSCHLNQDFSELSWIHVVRVLLLGILRRHIQGVDV